MKQTYLTLMTLSALAMNSYAEKSLYIPREWQNRTDTLIYSENDPNNQYTWSKSRSKETENYIVYWDNKYGNTIPTNASSTYSVDIDDLLAKAEGFYAMNVGKLAFCDEGNSNVSKYKMMILLNYTTDWVCYGGGYDDTIGALWLSPSTSKPVGHSVAHEVGHSFQYQVYADLKGYAGFRTAIGNGSTFWEQTAQWQANQSYPELKWEQSWNLYKNTHNYAMTHEWHRYQSYWWHYYLAENYGIDIIGKLWRHNSGKGIDPNQAYMSMQGIDANALYLEYFKYAMKMATVDLDVAREEADNYYPSLSFDYISLGGSKHQVTYRSCPQSTGFNIIPLNVPAGGTEITTDFTSLANGAALPEGDKKQYFDGDKFTTVNTNTYNSISNYAKRGFHLGYVALKNDGSREYLYDEKVYCTGTDATAEISSKVSCVVPEGTKRLFLVVSPSPSEYIQHKWDENITNDDQWPYTVEFTNTNIYGFADINNGPISDATVTYDVYFPESSSVYVGTSVKVDGTAASALGTAFQMQAASVGGLMTEWNTSGPADGKAMFYAVDANGAINNAASTANGYGHWFDASGNRSAYASGYVFSEFDSSTMTFTLGQYPGKTKDGDNYTIRQAIKYKKGDKTAVATFVFNIHITSEKTGYEVKNENDNGDKTSTKEIASKAIYPVEYYSISGARLSSPQRGFNLVKMSDGSVIKIIED